MALSLAVATSFMGSTAEAKVQEGRQGKAARDIEGTHTMVDDGSWRDNYREWNSEYHFYTDHIRLKCVNCTLRISSDEEEYEYHDMRGVSQAPYRAHCIKCGYEE